ncbi:MAG: putative porin, partial [Bacteroidota bacterium]
MKSASFYILLIFSFLALPERAACQFRPGGGGGGFSQFPGAGGSSGGASSLGEVTLDTSDIFYFFSSDLNQVFPFSDSLLGEFQQYDPIRRQPYDFAHLNNLGSAHRPLFFQPAWRRGFDVGLHQFDLYQLENQDVRFYKITQAYTQALYSQGSSQGDALFDIKFSRNFAKGLNLSLEHRRINNAGAYDYQRALNSSVAAGLWLHSEGGRYDGFFTFTTNSIQQEDNGGVSQNLADTLLPPFRVEVNLRTASTRYSNKEFSLTQYFRLSGKKEKPIPPVAPPVDTLRDAGKIQIQPGGRPPQNQAPPTQKPAAPPQNQVPPGQAKPSQPPVQQAIPSFAQPEIPPAPPKRTFTIFHQIAWRTNSYKFSDAEPDTAFYQKFLVDSRGLRHFLETKKLENTFKLQTVKLRQTGEGGRQTIGEGDLMEVGLVHA